jgi:hypothetical protein
MGIDNWAKELISALNKMEKARLKSLLFIESWMVSKGLPIKHLGKLDGQKGANLGLWMVAKALRSGHSQNVAFRLYLALTRVLRTGSPIHSDLYCSTRHGLTFWWQVTNIRMLVVIAQLALGLTPPVNGF